MPVQVENIGLVVNTKLAKVPTTFAQLETEALKVKKKKHLTFGIACSRARAETRTTCTRSSRVSVATSSAPTRPATSTRRTSASANPTFLKNAALDRQVEQGRPDQLEDRQLDAQNAFLKGQTAFWITGPWTVDDAPEGRRDVQGHPGARDRRSRPCRSWACNGHHGHEVRDGARRRLGGEGPRHELLRDPVGADAARGGGRPSSGEHKAKSSDPILAQFGAASKGGVPMPNIPQMNSVWSDLGQAWVRSTKGAGAMPAAASFKGAARAIAAKIG